MLSYQATGAGGPLEKIEIDTPVPIGSEVLLRTIACGVCHSDIHPWPSLISSWLHEERREAGTLLLSMGTRTCYPAI